MFQCRATSHGRQRNLMYHWLIVDEDKVVIDDANSNTLVISNVRRDDDGRMYQCGATNENGTTLSTIGRINGKETIVTDTYCSSYKNLLYKLSICLSICIPLLSLTILTSFACVKVFAPIDVLIMLRILSEASSNCHSSSTAY